MLAKSKFGPLPPPKASRLFVSPNGFIIANQDPPPGIPQASAVALVNGQCYALGTHTIASGSECTIESMNPRRTVHSMKMGDTVVKTEAELDGEATLKIKQTVSLAGGSPMVFDLVYTKATQTPPAATKK